MNLKCRIGMLAIESCGDIIPCIFFFWRGTSWYQSFPLASYLNTHLSLSLPPVSVDVCELYHVLELIYFRLLPFSVADTLLWKDKKQTLITLLVLVAIYYNFIASQSTIVTAASKLLLVVSVFLFIHGNLPEKVYACLRSFFTCQ